MLEREGLPPIDPLMGGRFWPAVRAFWLETIRLSAVEASALDGRGNARCAPDPTAPGLKVPAQPERLKAALLVRPRPITRGPGSGPRPSASVPPGGAGRPAPHRRRLHEAPGRDAGMVGAPVGAGALRRHDPGLSRKISGRPREPVPSAEAHQAPDRIYTLRLIERAFGKRALAALKIGDFPLVRRGEEAEGARRPERVRPCLRHHQEVARASSPTASWRSCRSASASRGAPGTPASRSPPGAGQRWSSPRRGVHPQGVGDGPPLAGARPPRSNSRPRCVRRT